MKYILLGGCSLHQCVHSARCGKMYVGVMCPVFSSAHARVNACARTRQQGVSLLRILSGESPSFV